MAAAPAACNRQFGTVASSAASALHASQPTTFAVSIACRNLSITGISVIAASLSPDHRARVALQPVCSLLAWRRGMMASWPGVVPASAPVGTRHAPAVQRLQTGRNKNAHRRQVADHGD